MNCNFVIKLLVCATHHVALYEKADDDEVNPDPQKCVESIEDRIKVAKAFSVLGLLGGLVYVASTTAILVLCHITGSRANNRMQMSKCVKSSIRAQCTGRTV